MKIYQAEFDGALGTLRNVNTHYGDFISKCYINSGLQMVLDLLVFVFPIGQCSTI